MLNLLINNPDKLRPSRQYDSMYDKQSINAVTWILNQYISGNNSSNCQAGDSFPNPSINSECNAIPRQKAKRQFNKGRVRNIRSKHHPNKKQIKISNHRHKTNENEDTSCTCSSNLTTVTVHREDSSSPLILHRFPSHNSSGSSSFDENLSLSENIPLYTMYHNDMQTASASDAMSSIRGIPSASSSDDLSYDYHCV